MQLSVQKAGIPDTVVCRPFQPQLTGTAIRKCQTIDANIFQLLLAVIPLMHIQRHSGTQSLHLQALHTTTCQDVCSTIKEMVHNYRNGVHYEPQMVMPQNFCRIVHNALTWPTAFLKWTGIIPLGLRLPVSFHLSWSFAQFCHFCAKR